MDLQESSLSLSKGHHGMLGRGSTVLIEIDSGCKQVLRITKDCLLNSITERRNFDKFKWE